MRHKYFRSQKHPFLRDIDLVVVLMLCVYICV